MTDQRKDQFKTSEITVVAYLLIRGFRPDRREEEKGRGILYYNRTPALNAAMVDFHNKCSACGITFSELGQATAVARRQLIDGMMGARHG